MAKWAVFISGRGSNLQYILDMGTDVQIVVSNKADALGLERAKKAGVETWVTPNPIEWEELHQLLLSRQVECLFLAGFMKLIPASFVNKWAGKMLNVHPSLLPQFPGTHAIEKSFEAGGDMGVTVHEVTAEMDAGPIVLQSSIFTSNSRNSTLTLAQAEIEISKMEKRLVTEAVKLWNLKHPSR